jgi:hypothetical protein
VLHAPGISADLGTGREVEVVEAVTGRRDDFGDGEGTAGPDSYSFFYDGLKIGECAGLRGGDDGGGGGDGVDFCQEFVVDLRVGDYIEEGCSDCGGGGVASSDSESDVSKLIE